MSMGLAPDLLRRLDRQRQRVFDRDREVISRSEVVRRALEHYLDEVEDDDDRLDDEILATRAIERRVVRSA